MVRNSVKIISSSDWFGFIRIDVSELIGLSQIDFRSFFIKRDTKRYSDWFGMIRIGSDTDIGMNRNSSNKIAYSMILVMISIVRGIISSIIDIMI